MSDLDFYAHVATRCDVFGAGIGSSPGAWDAAVGTDYLDDSGEGLLRRDYGLVELSFSDVEGPMSCFGISVQIHRLIHGLFVPTSLTAEYGSSRHAPGSRTCRTRSCLWGVPPSPTTCRGTSIATAWPGPVLVSSSSTTLILTGVATMMSMIRKLTKRATCGH